MTRKLKSYSVGYWVEQGFTITVEARSAAHAEQQVRDRLDCEMDSLDGSERVHHDDGICSVDVLLIGGAS